MLIAAFPVLWEFLIVTWWNLRGSTMYLLKKILGRQLDVAIRAQRVQDDRRVEKCGSIIVE